MALKTHKVAAGDTVSQIAQRYGVPISAVSGYKSGDANKIGVGEVLNIGVPDTPPANRINATDLGATPLTPPPTPTPTKRYSLQSLAESTTAKIEGLQPTVTEDETKIRNTYDKIGQQAVKRSEAYASEETPFGTVNAAQKELSDINNMIKQKDLAHKRRIEKIQEENPTGQLAEGQRIAIEKADREWAREAADLSIIAEVKLGNFNAAKGIIDERVDAETEDLQAELAGLQFFYSQNYNRLTDLQRTQLQQETAIVSDELNQTRAREQQIGQIQLEAAKNGADPATIMAISRATDITEAIASAGGFIGKLERDREARLGSEGGGSSTFFTKTQKAKGAAAAGVTLEEFDTYDTDTQNFFVNSFDSGKSMIDEAFADNATLEDVQAAISEAGLPEAGVASLTEYANEQWEGIRPLTPEEEYEDITNALKSYQEQGYGRDEAFEAEFKFQTEDEKGNSLGLPSSQTKQIEKNIKDALVDVYGRTFWQRILPGGR